METQEKGHKGRVADPRPEGFVSQARAGSRCRCSGRALQGQEVLCYDTSSQAVSADTSLVSWCGPTGSVVSQESALQVEPSKAHPPASVSESSIEKAASGSRWEPSSHTAPNTLLLPREPLTSLHPGLTCLLTFSTSRRTTLKTCFNPSHGDTNCMLPLLGGPWSSETHRDRQ